MPGVRGARGWCQQGHKLSASKAALFCRQQRQQGREQLLSATFAVWQLLLCQHRIVSLTVQINQEEKSKQLGKDKTQPDSALGSRMFPDAFHELVMLWRCITPLSFPDLSLLGSQLPICTTALPLQVPQTSPV